MGGAGGRIPAAIGSRVGSGAIEVLEVFGDEQDLADVERFSRRRTCASVGQETTLFCGELKQRAIRRETIRQPRAPARNFSKNTLPGGRPRGLAHHVRRRTRRDQCQLWRAGPASSSRSEATDDQVVDRRVQGTSALRCCPPSGRSPSESQCATVRGSRWGRYSLWDPAEQLGVVCLTKAATGPVPVKPHLESFGISFRDSGQLPGSRP